MNQDTMFMLMAVLLIVAYAIGFGFGFLFHRSRASEAVTPVETTVVLGAFGATQYAAYKGSHMIKLTLATNPASCWRLLRDEYLADSVGRSRNLKPSDMKALGYRVRVVR